MSNTLQNWLQTATDNLAPRAVTQISNEITAHVRSAAAQHQLEGMAENAALELAVKELGSAKAAARGYRQAHLTATEFQMLRRGDCTQIVTRVLFIVIYIGLAAFQFGSGFGPLGISSLLIYTSIAVASAIGLLAERFERVEQRALCQLIAMISMVTCFLVAYSFFIIEGLKFSSDSPLAGVGGLVLLASSFWIMTIWNLWRKTVHIASSQLRR